MNAPFNIFEILSKDDKELSHSSFIKFLLDQEDGFFLEKFFGIKEKPSDIILEHSLSIERENEKNKKLRLDILLQFPNKTIAIENKFKCLPTVKQLEDYTTALDDNAEKYLLYFADGKDFKKPADWKSITYSRISQLIDEYLNQFEGKLNPEKEIFITHYNKSLKKYIQKYISLKDANQNELKKIFNQPNPKDESKNNKFWLHLMFHELAASFDAEGYRTWVGRGGSYKPLMNVHHNEWTFKNEESIEYEFVIQLNGRNLKYYAHLKGIKNKQTIVNDEIERLKNNGFTETKSRKFKGKVSDKSNTCYIYQEDILHVLEEAGKTITLSNLHNAIESFKTRIGTKKTLHLQE